MTLSFRILIPLALGIFLLAGYHFATAQWTAAPGSAPSGNVTSLLNESATAQTKDGSLGVLSLSLNSNAPSLFLSDESPNATSTDFWLYNNTDSFYILADRDDSGAWESTHPLQITVGATSASDIATFSNSLRAQTLTAFTRVQSDSFCNEAGTTCYTHAELAPAAAIDTSTFLTTGASQTKTGGLTVNGNLTGGNLFTAGQVRTANLCDAAGANCTAPSAILDTSGASQTKSGNLIANILAADSRVQSDSYCNRAGGNCSTAVEIDNAVNALSGTVKIQKGNANVPMSDGNPTIGFFDVTFPTAFANVPTVTFTPRWVRYTGDEPTSWWITNITTTGFRINWKTPGAGTTIGQNGVQWIAMD